MKNLFNDISQDEKNRILEMHSGKKNVINEQSIGGAIDWIKDKVKNILPNSFKAEATVEGDMVMEFPVVEFHYGSDGVYMFFKEDDKLLNVHNFKGPIFSGTTKKYRDSSFSNINSENWKTIAKQHNIPVSKVTV